MRDPCAMTVLWGKRRGSLRVPTGWLPESLRVASGWLQGGLGVAARLGPASPLLTPSLRAETAVCRELILVFGTRGPTFAATS
jgi:hypothetical protein